MIRRFGAWLTLPIRQVAFEWLFLPSVPPEFREATRIAFDGRLSSEEERVAKELEDFRRAIPQRYPRKLASYRSPHSGAFRYNDQGHAEPGQLLESQTTAHAQTGVSPAGGAILKRIAEGVGASRVLELGTNTGFSATYFLSANCEPELVTVEGSEDLCQIASDNLSRFNGRYEIINSLFDDAIDRLIVEESEKFDLVFIDGQHEKNAVLHYADRVHELMRAGGACIFDDIYWSEDMNDAWRDICESTRYDVTIDLGRGGGVATIGGGDAAPRHYDLFPYKLRPRIYRQGW